MTKITNFYLLDPFHLLHPRKFSASSANFYSFYLQLPRFLLVRSIGGILLDNFPRVFGFQKFAHQRRVNGVTGFVGG